MNSALPPQVRTLIIDRIHSVVQLEILLLLRAEPARYWSVEEVTTHFRIDPTWAGAQLAELVSQGLVKPMPGASLPAYYYAPKSAELDRAVVELDRAYSDLRVSVISLIYSKPSDTLKTFVDAFRIRNPKG